MTPELEAELNKIGWANARHHPSAIAWKLTLQPKAGLIASWPTEAAAAHERLLVLWNAIQTVRNEIDALTDDARRFINLTSTPPDERDGGWPDHLANAVTALQALDEGLISWGTGLRHAAEHARAHRPKNEPAYRVAGVLAEIYFVGLGRMPGNGNIDGTSKPSTPFGKVAKQVMGLLGIEIRGVYSVCAAAIAELSEARQADLRNPKSFRDPSLFDVWHSRKSPPDSS